MRQFIPQAAVILVSAVEEDLLRATDKVSTLWAPTLHCKVISNLSKLNSHRLLLTTYHPHPFPACSDLVLPWHPQPPTTESSAVQRTEKSHSSSIYALFSSVQWLRKISLQGNQLFCHVSVNSIHSFSHTNKTELLHWTSKLVGNNNR